MPRSSRTTTRGGSSDATPALRRCAIYTRKSSEEGLEQAFNSLDAQREACEAFILSQKHAGWIALPAMYDDGGLSGGTLERPALQRLLADIAAGRVDAVVVYKVDRLTRSLADFAKIVDIFDASGVAFVSVTQQFNTTSSMGRLTLNMLLSFAQFEREVTGERIRDKIALSKQKGMWMGGNPPLGYDAADRKLVVNDAEAETVRHIFGRYVALRSVRDLGDELRRDGIVSKARSGQRHGAQPLARGALYYMLGNRLYRGEIVHKGVAYPGQHPAIIDETLWQRVQSILAENRVERGRGGRRTQPSLLTGLIYDEAGDRLSPSHATKGRTRYRYYVSQALLERRRTEAPPGACRVPAADLEALVETALREMLSDAATLHDVARAAFPDDARRRKALLIASAERSRSLPTLPTAEKMMLFRTLIHRITVRTEAVEIEMSGTGLMEAGSRTPDVAIATSLPPLLRIVPARLKRTGRETRLLIDAPPTPARDPDRSLLRLLARAHQFHRAMMANHGQTMRDLAREAGVSPTYFARIVRLAFLSPALTDAILQGRHPESLTANKLQHLALPNAWHDQQQLIHSL